jgi:hypothetical protein
MKKSTLFFALALAIPSFAFAQPNFLDGVESDEVIKDQPAGTLHSNQCYDSETYYSSSGYPILMSSNGLIREWVEGDDGNIYIHNPFSRAVTDSWLKGTVQNDTVTFKPQAIYQVEGESGIITYYAANVVKGDYSISANTEKTDVQFLLKDGNLTQIGDDVLGLVDTYGSWDGYADFHISLTAVDGEITTVPDGVDMTDYVIRFHSSPTVEDGAVVKVGFDGNDVYITGFDKTTGNNALKGTIEGDQLLIDNPFFLNLDEEYSNSFIFALSAVQKEVEDYWKGVVYDYTPAQAFHFKFDDNDDSFSSDSTLIINYGAKLVKPVQVYVTPEFSPLEYVAGEPKAPSFYNFNKYEADYGYGSISIVLPKFTVDNYFMNLEDVYYNIYLNDELYTLSPNVYSDMTEEVTDIPYSYTMSGLVKTGPVNRMFTYYTDRFYKIGVQMHYKFGDEVFSSNLVEYILDEELGISSTTGKSSVNRVEYYDLAGRRVSSPAHGVYVKRIVMADGTVETSKVAVE